MIYQKKKTILNLNFSFLPAIFLLNITKLHSSRKYTELALYDNSCQDTLCILLETVHSNGRLINENMHQYKKILYLKHKFDTVFKLETTILCIQGLYGLAIDLNKDPVLLNISGIQQLMLIFFIFLIYCQMSTVYTDQSITK